MTQLRRQVSDMAESEGCDNFAYKLLFLQRSFRPSRQFVTPPGNTHGHNPRTWKGYAQARRSPLLQRIAGRRIQMLKPILDDRLGLLGIGGKTSGQSRFDQAYPVQLILP